MRETAGDRLRKAREAAGYESAAAFAEANGLTESSYRSQENGTRGLTVPAAKLYAPKLNTTWQYLIGGDGVAPAPQPVVIAGAGIIEVSGTEFARLPVYDIRFAMGAGASDSSLISRETPIDHYLVSMNLLRSLTDAPISEIAIFQAAGDSMEPTIYNRDWVFVDRRRTRLTNPGIYALTFEGDGLLKRAAQHLETKAVTLMSDNPKYPPQTIKKPDRLTVVGRVFMSIRRH